VPKTRLDVDREQKVAEILEAAERRLREGGYDALSVAAIARDLGIAQNAIYWYFPTKDHLFVAALETMLRHIITAKPKAGSATEKILWFVDQLEALYGLRGSLRERARHSDVAVEFAENLNRLLRTMLSNTLAPHLPKSELSLAVDTFAATVDGTFVRQMKPSERQRVLRFALKRLLATAGS
jgi:AcrR family transcriptional regulator